MDELGDRPAVLPVMTNRPLACKSFEPIAAAAAAEAMFCPIHNCISAQKLLLFAPPPTHPPATLNTRASGGIFDMTLERKRLSSLRVGSSTGMYVVFGGKAGGCTMSRQKTRHPKLLKCCVTTRPTDPLPPRIAAAFI
jgi:hypothetical protein